jgi:uncharacterized membrane protein
MLEWISMAPTIGASFAASLVECVEALTVVLAVGTIRGWRWALAGTGAAVLTLILLVGVLGPSVALIPLTIAQLLVGTLLLLFGLRWVRKSILRYARVLALHDEHEVYVTQTSSLSALSHTSSHAWDGVAFASAFKIVMLEGMEVVFIVIAIGAGGPLIAPAAAGAIAAFAIVLALGACLHRPLARVPENALKFLVGVLLTAFGTFWAGEGMHLLWPGADWSLLALIAIYLAVGICLISVFRSGRPRPQRQASSATAAQPKRALASLLAGLASLFIDDVSLGAGTLVCLVVTRAVSRYTAVPVIAVEILLVAGLCLLLGHSIRRAARP